MSTNCGRSFDEALLTGYLDGVLTQAQIHSIFANYMTAVDFCHPRLRAAIEAGRITDREDPMAMARRLLAGGGLPDALAAALARLTGSTSGDDDEDDISHL